MNLIYKSFDYSPITQGSLNLVVPWIASTDDPNYIKYGELHSGIDVLAANVHAVVPGVVLQVVQDKDSTWSVSVQYDVNQIIRYCNLREAYVSIGQIIMYKDTIGQCKNVLHFEYAKLSPIIIPEWNVKLGICTYYKQNPLGVLDGSIQFNLEAEYIVDYELNPNIQTRF